MTSKLDLTKKPLQQIAAALEAIDTLNDTGVIKGFKLTLRIQWKRRRTNRVT